MTNTVEEMNVINMFNEIIGEKKCSVYGIRVESEDYYTIGDEHRNSHQWWQDDPEDESPYNEDEECWDGGEVNGTCAITLRHGIDYALSRTGKYIGEILYLIGGDWDYDGNDVGEVIIENAVVLAKANKSSKLAYC